MKKLLNNNNKEILFFSNKSSLIKNEKKSNHQAIKNFDEMLLESEIIERDSVITLFKNIRKKYEHLKGIFELFSAVISFLKEKSQPDFEVNSYSVTVKDYNNIDSKEVFSINSGLLNYYLDLHYAAVYLLTCYSSIDCYQKIKLLFEDTFKDIFETETIKDNVFFYFFRNLVIAYRFIFINIKDNYRHEIDIKSLLKHLVINSCDNTSIPYLQYPQVNFLKIHEDFYNKLLDNNLIFFSLDEMEKHNFDYLLHIEPIMFNFQTVISANRIQEKFDNDKLKFFLYKLSSNFDEISILEYYSDIYSFRRLQLDSQIFKIIFGLILNDCGCTTSEAFLYDDKFFRETLTKFNLKGFTKNMII